MKTPIAHESTVEQIRERFDKDVERFSSLETGQTATIDATVAMTLIAEAACACTKPIRRVLDIGCGAGNNTLRLREIAGHNFDVDLLDLSGPMFERAAARVAQANPGLIRTMQAGFGLADVDDSSDDVILAAAVLHHVGGGNDWLRAFEGRLGSRQLRRNPRSPASNPESPIPNPYFPSPESRIPNPDIWQYPHRAARSRRFPLAASPCSYEPFGTALHPRQPPGPRAPVRARSDTRG